MAHFFNRLTAATALIGIISIPSLGLAVETTQRPVVVRRHVVVKKRHPVRKTIKRVGIGAAGGAAAGALIGGGPGAAVGAVVGGGAGAIYDHHEKSKGN